MDSLYFFTMYFMMKCLITILLYPIIFNGISYIYPKLKYERKIYIVSNLIKGLMLLYLCMTYYTKLFSIFRENEWNSFVYKKITVSYAVTDFCSLFIVNKLKISTIIHHIIVVLFSFIIVYQEIYYNTILYSIIVYGFFSCLAYLVNIFLGMRFLMTAYMCKIMCNISYSMYMCCCCINWLYQFKFICTNIFTNFVNISIYTGAISLLIYDDIILLQFLEKNR